ncbi:hypothetical protein [Roseibacillus persicicus]|uniref:Type IV pilus biogenesis protein PilP n=1 Tax=Roseibacillus persicicus TaxID=454148 RepID=A0A918WEN8_9BACT|nr:hypothetical protein [Roseibacillus persicicus]MDQ8190719.1 hypothetical protein [Roseibacillus persicicus]GHC40727.1 hypothetical protein GCM10007100_01570 [Roseibacillus persicicus]
MDQLTKVFSILATFAISSPALAQGANASKGKVLVDARDQIGAIQEYISQQKSKLAIQGKSTDIFGLPQDPKKAKAIAVATTKRTEVVKKPTLPLQRVLDALPLTMMDPVGNRIIINGSPPIKAGENLELAVGGETVLLRLEGVRSNGAYFRDMKTKKLGLRSMTKLPKGIQRGGTRSNGPKEIQRIDLNQSQTIKVDLDLASD